MIWHNIKMHLEALYSTCSPSYIEIVSFKKLVLSTSCAEAFDFFLVFSPSRAHFI
jgi:hypothetical protein